VRAWVVDASAFGGAVAVSMMLYLLARRDLRGGSAARRHRLLLLTGVILSSLCMALVTLMLSIAPESRLRSMIFWMIGDLAGAPLRALPWIVLAAGLLFALRSARSLNVLALHAEAAATLGIRVGALRKGLFFCSGLLTASAVTSAGSIGFVGLIVPHALPLCLRPRPPPADTGRHAGRRRLPGAGRYAGAHCAGAAAVAGRRGHGADRRAGLPVPTPPAAQVK
jgi:iron complex transport system permease protein